MKTNVGAGHAQMHAHLKTEKLAALDGFGKLTSISAKSANEISGILASDDPDLRRRAVAILTEFAYPQARRPLEEWLNGSEEDQTMACQAIHAFAKDHADEWIDLIGPIAAGTNNVELFQIATFVLGSSSLDYSRYVVPAASHPDEAIRRQAIYAIGKGVTNSHTIHAILKGLTDESSKVVHAALQAHDKPFDDRFLEAYASIAARYQVEENYVLANLKHHLKAIGYNSTHEFLADFKKRKVRRPSLWSRIFRRES